MTCGVLQESALAPVPVSVFIYDIYKRIKFILSKFVRTPKLSGAVETPER